MSATIGPLAQLTDAELRAAQLRVSDPETQPNLADTIPEGTDLLGIENLYEADGWPDHKVYCARCEGRHHMRGFTVLLVDGRRALLGSKCGGDVFGQSWHAATHDFKERLDRRRILERLHAIADRAPVLRAGIGAWYDTATKLRASRSRFKNALFYLDSALTDACNTDGGRLKTYETYRDLIAEEQSKSENTAPIMRERETVAYTVRGGEYFARLDPVVALDEAFEAVNAVVTLARTDTTNVKTRQLQAAVRRCTAAAGELARVEAMYRGALTFFEDANLIPVAAWATRAEYVTGQYAARSGVVRRLDEAGTMSLPQFDGRLDAEVVRLLRADAE